MRYCITPKSGAYGTRIWLERSPFTATDTVLSVFTTIDLVKKINPLSKWGGFDKSGKNFIAWEFGYDWQVDEAKKILQKDGHMEEMFDAVYE